MNLTSLQRLNHDFRPNANYYFDPQTLAHQVFAIRSIYPGEELTISYIHTEQIKENRQRQTKQWGFECTCSLCSASSAVTRASDQRITQILGILEQLDDTDLEGETAISMVELLMSLYKHEGLDAPIASAYSNAAIEYNGVGKSWIAIKYAHLAIDSVLLYEGLHSELGTEMGLLLEDPKSHCSWGYRLRSSD